MKTISCNSMTKGDKMNNPYLKEAEELAQKYSYKLEYEYEDLNIGGMLESVIGMYTDENFMNFVHDRLDLRMKYAHSIPNKKAIETICEFSPIFEVGSGTGYWANLIDENGGDITCLETKEKNYYKLEEKGLYYPAAFVDNVSSFDSISKYYSLLMIYPPAGTNEDESKNMAYNYLNAYKGEIFLYIGENMFGSNATEEFFGLIDNNWNLIKTIAIPRFHDIYQQLWVYKRK